MGPLSYMRSVVDRNVVMRRIAVIYKCQLGVQIVEVALEETRCVSTALH